MHRYWNTVIEPILTIIRPKAIVEIGSKNGDNTARILEYCEASQAKLYSIDPFPQFDSDAWVAKHRDIFVFFESLSLSALPLIRHCDVCLIDGDHNWYTVFNELKLLEDQCRKYDNEFPLVFCHDIGWPYGRRDLYYNPDNIPDLYRNPYKKMGILPGKSDLLEEGGLNGYLCNAVYENNSQNGVLTAVEDFIEQAETAFKFLKIPGLHGLGILIPSYLSKTNSELVAFISQLEINPVLRKFIEQVEFDRITGQATIKQQQRKQAILVQENNEVLQHLKVKNEHHLEDLKDKQSLIDKQANQHDLVVAQFKNALQDKDERISHLQKYLDEIGVNYKNILKSRRWKLGNLIGEYTRKLSFNRKPFVACEKIQGTLQHYKKTGKLEVPKDKEKQINSKKLGNENTVQKPKISLSESVDIIICVHNAIDDVKKCIDSVEKYTDLKKHALIIVNDGSDSETTSFLLQTQARLGVRYIHNKSAKGYTHSANQGLQISQKEFSLLLNSDCIVTPHWLEQLLSCAKTMPNTGIVGPLSNAASWQSIPSRTASDGGWLVNTLPGRTSLDEFAVSLSRRSSCLYPEVDLVNGFCYMISRELIRKIGYLDERSFPQGYGEEDDYSLRCKKAGLKLYIADNCYVYHAKSKSFTPTKRLELVKKSKGTLASKHGKEHISSVVRKMLNNERLLRAQSNASVNADLENTPIPFAEFSKRRLVIGWLQPHLETCGGIRRTIEMTNRLTDWGAEVYLLTPDGKKSTWLPIKSNVCCLEDAFKLDFDVLIVSDPYMIESFMSIPAKTKLNYHLAAYMLYRNKDKSLEDYYRYSENVTHVANSNWTAEMMQLHYCIDPLRVFPGGINRDVFYPARIQKKYDVVMYGSERPHKGTDTLLAATEHLDVLRLVDVNPSQSELAGHISSGAVFASGCLHEGFNFCPLEAMACGIPVAMTDCGGSREYARDGYNASIVPPNDGKAMTDAIDTLLHDKKIRIQYIENGIKTAARYTWDNVTVDFAKCILHLKNKESIDYVY